MNKQKAVLAYSGGLDTSVILKYMIDKGFDVTAYMADLGQLEDKKEFEAAEQKAREIGATDVRIIDLKQEFVDDFIFPAIRASAKYEGRYLLGTSLARPLTARAHIDLAKEIGATILAHGATGKGNDQVRFELAYRTLMPEADIFSPWKEPEFLKQFDGREDLIDFALANKIPIDQTKQEPWSSDENMLHRSYEAGMLEESTESMYFERMFAMTVSIKKAPSKETLIELKYHKGNPVALKVIKSFKQNPINGLPEDIKYSEEYTNSLDIFLKLNEIAGANAVGRQDMVESRFVGMKSRGVYETPAGTVLHAAHQDLEAMCLDREVMKLNQILSIFYAERVYSGFWFSPEMRHLQNWFDDTQQVVNGTVRVGLNKGNVIIKGRSSPTSLYDEKIASMNEAGGYDQTKARGFIDINAVRLQADAKRAIKLQEYLAKGK